MPEHKEQWKVYTCLHTLALWSPCRPKHRSRWSSNVAKTRRLDLGEIATKVTNDVGALEVWRQLTEGEEALALGSSRFPYSQSLAPFAENLFRGCHWCGESRLSLLGSNHSFDGRS